ncbi:MAG: hypothetical protein MSG78_07255 [Clostridiales bacterium]|nr:hypothetical protein [Clostridiales bacterium]
MTETIYDDILNAEMLLIGIGKEVSEKQCKKEELDEAYHQLEKLLKGRNYFVLTSNTDGAVHRTKIIPMLIAAPYEEGGEEQWQSYMNWITCTLGHSLVILELGEGFEHPQLMRWPFEKMVMVNQKAKLIRVGEAFPQIPKDIGERAVSVKMNCVKFLRQLQL